MAMGEGRTRRKESQRNGGLRPVAATRHGKRHASGPEALTERWRPTAPNSIRVVARLRHRPSLASHARLYEFKMQQKSVGRMAEQAPGERTRGASGR